MGESVDGQSLRVEEGECALGDDEKKSEKINTAASLIKTKTQQGPTVMRCRPQMR